MKKVILVLCVLLLCNPPYIYSKTFHFQEFSIKLPEGWVEIPTEQLNSYAKSLKKIVPKDYDTQFNYGFQLKSKQWLKHPFILIKIFNTGRIPKNELKKFEQFPVQKEAEKVEKDLKGFLLILNMEKMVYDSQRNILWIKTRGKYLGKDIYSIGGHIPTERGLIGCYGHALLSDFHNYAPVFKESIESINVDPQIRYRSKITDRSPAILHAVNWGKIIGKALVFAITIAIFYAVIGLFRKKDESIK